MPAQVFKAVFMFNPFKFLFDSIREDLGIPVTLLRLIQEHSDLSVQLIEPKQVIAAGNVVAWHKWGDDRHSQYTGQLSGWKYSNGEYYSCQVHQQEIVGFVRCNITNDWTCDIQDVAGLSSSKSDLTSFISLDDMVEADSPEMIDQISEEKLAQNLAFKEIRILHSPDAGDHFVCYQWDGRIFLANNGGSHHFAAARYIAARMGRPVPLVGKLYSYAIDSFAVEGLRREFDMYAISNKPEICNEFLKSMRSFRAAYYWRYLPMPYKHAQLILLPKNNKRSVRASTALRDAGVFDVGAYFSTLP